MNYTRIIANVKWFYFLVLSFLLMLSLSHSRDWVRTSGDVLQIFVPAYALGTTYGDASGFWQMTSSFVITQGLVIGLKEITQRKRPDYSAGDARDSFPSGHTASAFSGASFIHFRYGFKQALPFYGLATVTGYSRIHANKHHFTDVLAGAALAIGVNYLIVTPKNATDNIKQKHSFTSFALDPLSKGAFLFYNKVF